MAFTEPLGRSTSLPSLGGPAVAAVAAAVQLTLIALGSRSGMATWSLVAVASVGVLPLLVWAALAAVGADRRRARELVDLADRRTLAARAAHAEAAVARSQERVHELRSTLSSLRLSHELLVDRSATLSRATRRRLERLHTTELARVERLLSEGRCGEVSAVRLDEVLGPMVDAMGLRGCAVRWQRTGSRAYGRADDVTEIVHVLLDNAARHAGGQAVELATAARGRWVELRVRDGGPGVPRALAPVLFDRGTRAEDSEGQGIGLHVARRLARNLGGDLWLEPDRPSVGAEFVLRLPEARGLAPCLAPGA